MQALVLKALLQLIEHDAGDAGEVLLVKAVEADDLVHTVQEFGAQELAERLHRAVAVLLVHRVAEADGALLALAARVGCHHDDGVFKIDLAAVGVGDLAVVKNLQQDVHHIGMRLFDLVEEDDGVGLAADLLGELTGLVIADVARGRADDAGDRVLFHKLGHVEADERVGRVEEVLRQLLDKLGLADARGADKDEAHRLVLGRNAHTVAADGRSDSLDSLVLTDNVLF